MADKVADLVTDMVADKKIKGRHGTAHGGRHGGRQGDRHGGRQNLFTLTSTSTWKSNLVEGWSRGLVNWAQSISTRSIPGLRIF